MKSIITQSNNYRSPVIEMREFDEIEKINRYQHQMRNGISAFIEAERLTEAQRRLQSHNQQYNRKFDDDQHNTISNIMDYIQEKKSNKEMDKVNFMNKETIGEITRENF